MRERGPNANIFFFVVGGVGTHHVLHGEAKVQVVVTLGLELVPGLAHAADLARLGGHPRHVGVDEDGAHHPGAAQPRYLVAVDPLPVLLLLRQKVRYGFHVNLARERGGGTEGVKAKKRNEKYTQRERGRGGWVD